MYNIEQIFTILNYYLTAGKILQKKQNRIIPFTIIIISLILLLNHAFDIFQFSNLYISIICFVFGVIIFYRNFCTKSGLAVFLSSVLALTGLYSYVFNEFRFFSTYKAYPITVVFVFATSFFLLFLHNTKKKIHLILSLLLAFLTVLLFNAESNSLLFYMVNKSIYIIWNYLPLVLIVFGIKLILTKKEKT